MHESILVYFGHLPVYSNFPDRDITGTGMPFRVIWIAVIAVHRHKRLRFADRNFVSILGNFQCALTGTNTEITFGACAFYGRHTLTNKMFSVEEKVI